jgi:hypothetical protein
MEYWILQHNPAILHNVAARPSKEDYWRIRWYDNRVDFGDVAFIWYAGSARGIYNVAKIISVPPHSHEVENKMNQWWEEDRPYYDTVAFNRLSQYQAILIQYEYEQDFGDSSRPPVSVAELTREGFGGLLIIRMPRLGIYSIDQAVGERLLEYIRRTRGEG